VIAGRGGTLGPELTSIGALRGAPYIREALVKPEAAHPSGYLVVRADKEVDVNSEKQQVTVRGVVRPTDLSTANTISSNQIAQMELTINGKGVVGDAVRRPFILWRVLLGILPF